MNSLSDSVERTLMMLLNSKRMLKEEILDEEEEKSMLKIKIFLKGFGIKYMVKIWRQFLYIEP